MSHIHRSMLSDCFPVLAACATVANALSVVCTGSTDSQAVTCESGYYVNAGACSGMCPCHAGEGMSPRPNRAMRWSQRANRNCSVRGSQGGHERDVHGREQLAGRSLQLGFLHIGIPRRVHAYVAQVEDRKNGLVWAVLTARLGLAECTPVGGAALVTCTDATDSKAVSCENGKYLASGGVCVGMSPGQHGRCSAAATIFAARVYSNFSKRMWT
jgi:hypothetical protein